MPHLLLIEDDPDLGPRLSRNLEFSGYSVTLARDGRSGLDTALNSFAHLILLDLMLPLVDGLHILQRLRAGGLTTPVIILTALSLERDRLEGFRAGCDDYVTKPFSLDELLARVKAVLRRCGIAPDKTVVVSGGLTVNPENRTVFYNGIRIEMTPREFDLLLTLTRRPNQALSRYFLLDEVWGDDSDVTIRTVDAHIAYIRRKLEVHPEVAGRIETVYKVGYRWLVSGQSNNDG
ncbi:MAG: response regulator transcription factor [Calditrichota bacterium]